jgi:hypothetical protein
VPRRIGFVSSHRQQGLLGLHLADREHFAVATY